MDIILARHGNTFAPGDKVVWAGRNEDFPLVEKGIQQAEDLAGVLLKLQVQPQAVFCGPLKRTRTSAEIIINSMKLELIPVIDDRLNEIDYGDWGGLSSEEVISRFGEQELNDWNAHSIWPLQAKWGSSFEETAAAVKSFSSDLQSAFDAEDAVLVVTSNGVLRFFLRLIQGEFEKRSANGSFKVKTGNVCRIICQPHGYVLEFWNKAPADLLPD